MRAQGYLVANLLAGLDVEKTLADPGFADAYAQWLVEKFLIATDDGWILRKAQYYRGAVQEEDERDTARRLLIGMTAFLNSDIERRKQVAEQLRRQASTLQQANLELASARDAAEAANRAKSEFLANMPGAPAR